MISLSGTLLCFHLSGPGEPWGKPNNFSFVGQPRSPGGGCHQLGDINLRVAPAGGAAVPRQWAYYTSADADPQQAPAPAVPSKDPNVLISHDITGFLNSTSTALRSHGPNPFFGEVPVTVVRSYEKDPDHHGGLVLRFEVTNRHTSSVVVGGLGLPM